MSEKARNPVPEANSSEDPLLHFQDVYLKATTKPGHDIYIKSCLDELEQKFNKPGDPEVKALARLCRARIQYAHNRQLSDARTRLKPLLQASRRSMTAACLSAALLDKSAKKGVVLLEEARKELEQIRSYVGDPLAPDWDESGWVDPAHEAIVKADKERFEDFKSAASKLERLRTLYGYLATVDLDSSEKAKKAKGKQSEQQSEQQQGSQEVQPSAGKQLTPEEAQARQLDEKRTKEAETVKNAIAEREMTDRDIGRALDALRRRLKEAGPEGSPERVKGLSNAFSASVADFEQTVRAEMDRFFSAEQYSATTKNFMLQQMNLQLSRLRATGVLLHLNLPDLRKLLDDWNNYGADISASATDKTDFGTSSSGAGGASGAKRGKNAVKASGKADKDKEKDKNAGGTAVAADSSSTATMVPATEPLKFMERFISQLQEQSADVRKKLFELAKRNLWARDLPLVESRTVRSFPLIGASLQDKDREELQQIAARDDISLADMLLRKVPGGDCARVGDNPQLDAMLSELVEHMRLGEQLVELVDEQPVNVSTLEARTAEAKHFQRASFASCLTELPLLQRQNVFEALASRFIHMAVLVEGDKEPVVAVSDTAIPLPDHPNEILQELSDPLLALQGYTAILRHRGLVPLPAPVLAGPSAGGGGPDLGDADHARLVRLCDHLLLMPETYASDMVVAVVDMYKNPAYTNVVRKLYGELPTEMVKAIRNEEAAAKKKASSDGPSANDGAAKAGGSDAAANGGAGEEGLEVDPIFGPFDDFEIRSDVPEAERAAQHEQWRRDILDALEVLEAGDCGLGRCLSSTIAGFVARTTGKRFDEIKVSHSALGPVLTELGTQELLQLRLHVLTQLGQRGNGTLAAYKDTVEGCERVARDDLWAVEVLKDKNSEKMRLSEGAYRMAVNRAWHRKVRQLTRLRVVHATKRVLDERRAASGEAGAASGATTGSANGGSTNGGSAVAAGGANAVAAGGGGGKKKGKGGAAAAAAAAPVDMFQLPPLPPGVTPPEVTDPELQLGPMDDYTDAYLRHLSVPGQYNEPFCALEVHETLRQILDPPQCEVSLGSVEAEAALVEEILVNDPSQLTPMELGPMFTLRDVLDDLVRGSMMETLRREELDALSERIVELLKNWAGLVRHMKEHDPAVLKEALEGIKKRLSSWAFPLIEQAVGAIGTDEARSEKPADRLARIESLASELKSKSFHLMAKMLRIVCIPYAARLEGARAIQYKLKTKYDELKNPQPAAASQPAQQQGQQQKGANARQAGKTRQPKASNNDQKRMLDLNQELDSIDNEVTFLDSICTPSGAIGKAIQMATEWAGAVSPKSMPAGMLKAPELTAAVIERLVVAALQAVQVYAFQLVIAENVVEELQTMARTTLRQAVLNVPVLELGVLGTQFPRVWLKSKLDAIISEETAAHLAEEEQMERDKLAEKKLSEQRKREEQEMKKRKEQEEQDAKAKEAKEAEQEQEEKEEERRKAQERAAEEEAARKKAMEAKPSRPVPMEAGYDRFILDMSKLDEDDEGEPSPVPPAESIAPKPVPRQGAGPEQGRLAARLASQQQQQQQQQQQGAARRDGGPGGPREGAREHGPSGKGGAAAASAAGAGGASAVADGKGVGAGGGAGKGGAGAGPPPRKGAANAHPQGSQQQLQPKGAGGARDAAGPPGATGAGSTPYGRDSGGRGGSQGGQAGGPPGHGGSGNRGGVAGSGPAQQQHHPEGKGGGGKGPGGGSGGAGAGGKGGGAAAAPAPAAQHKVVPGFDPGVHGVQAADVKSKPKRNRRGGGGSGGADTSAAAGPNAVAGRGKQSQLPPPAAAASGLEDEDAGGFLAGARGEHPHPPAAALEEEVTVDLTMDEPAGVASGYEPTPAELAGYPFRYPYPVPDPPPGWKVHTGFLLPCDEDPDFVYTYHDSRHVREEDVPLYRWKFIRDLSLHYMSAWGRPEVPPEALAPQDLAMPEAQPGESAASLPYAVPADLPPGGFPQPPSAVAEGAVAIGPAAMGPPFGPGGILPPHIAPYNRPLIPGLAPFPGAGPLPPMQPPGMMPPFPGGGMPFGPGFPGRPAAEPPVEINLVQAVEQEDEEDTDDLLGLLGVSAPAPRPAAAPAATAAPPVAAYSGFPPGFPGYGQPVQPVGPYGHGIAMGPMVPALSPPPQAAAMQEDEQGEVQPAAAAAATPEAAQPKPPARVSAAPAPAAPLSWAQRIAQTSRQGASVQYHQQLQQQQQQHRPGPRHLEPPPAAGDMDTEESQYEEVLHRSMRDNVMAAFPPLGGVAAAAAAATAAAAAAAAGRAAGLEGLSAPSSALVGTGLVNRVGEYNCFLNVIIQCLWHCTAFRQQMSTRNPDDFAEEHPVVAALLRLFRALDLAEEKCEQQRQQLALGSGAEVASDRHVVDPSELREALDALGVRAGEMNDASEVLGALFESLNRAPGLAGDHGAGGTSEALSVVDRTFALLLSEEVRCTRQDCGKVTHVVKQHVEYFVIIAAAGLRHILAAIDSGGGHVCMGRLIHEIEAQNTKRCDTDPPYHGCNTPTRVTRTLNNVPDVFTILLAWEPDVPAEAIAKTLELVDTVLQPQQIYSGGNCPHDMPAYALHGMFCYYGQHYFAFINRGPAEPESAQEWVMFDDAAVAKVGNWAQVIAKCRAGRIQPSVLFYQQYRR